MRPNFKNIDIKADAFGQQACGSIPCNEDEKWITPELIPVKPTYTRADIDGMEHLHYVAGLPPSCVARIAACTPYVLGLFVNMQDSLQPKSQTPFTVATLPRDKKASR